MNLKEAIDAVCERINTVSEWQFCHIMLHNFNEPVRLCSLFSTDGEVLTHEFQSDNLSGFAWGSTKEFHEECLRLT